MQLSNILSFFLVSFSGSKFGLGSSLAALPPLEHNRCELDPVLAGLAAKSLSVDGILHAGAAARQCLLSAGPDSKGPTRTRLVYVTPWNTDGYAYSTLHSEKLAFVSPVWYQVSLHGSSVKLEGQHDVNSTWLSSLSPTTQVVPRFEVKFHSKKEIEAILFFPQKESETIVDRIVEEVKTRGYAGATLEVPYTAQMKILIKKLGTALHEMEKKLILVIPAHHHVTDVSPFSRRDLLELQDSVDYFSLNAYDHASALGSDSGNAPLPWTKQILDELLSSTGSDSSDDEDPFGDEIFDMPEQSSDLQVQVPGIPALNKKILLGINFYGFTFTSDSVMNTITAREYSGLLEFSKKGIPLTADWDEEKGEHKMDGKIWSIWYPSLLSILYRLSLAEEYGTGISVWEGGQGLDYFWDVL